VSKKLITVKINRRWIILLNYSYVSVRDYYNDIDVVAFLCKHWQFVKQK